MYSEARLIPPRLLFISPYTAAPSDSGGGTEVNGELMPDKLRLLMSGNTATNAANVEYATATANYGTKLQWRSFDAATSGNLLAYGTLTTQKC